MLPISRGDERNKPIFVDQLEARQHMSVKDHKQPFPHANPTNHEWLSLRELAYYADISERTLRSWIHSPTNPLPAVKVCGKILVRKSEFDAYLQQYRVKDNTGVDINSLVQDVLDGIHNGR